MRISDWSSDVCSSDLDDADAALLEDRTGHDPDLAFVGGQHTGAVRADQSRFRARQRALHLDHVEHRNAFGDADDQLHLGVDRLEDRVGGERRRSEEHTSELQSLMRNSYAVFCLKKKKY